MTVCAANSGDARPEQQLSLFHALRRQKSGGELTAARGSVSLQVHLVAFDLETTGFSPQSDRIIEVALVPLDAPPLPVTVSSQLAARLAPLGYGAQPAVEPESRHFSTLVQPGMRVPRESIEVTLICDEMLVGAPRMPAVIDQVERFINGLPLRAQGGSTPGASAVPLFLLVAHNGKKFDSRFLYEEMRRAGRPVPPTGYMPTSFKLDALRAHFGIPKPPMMHRALPDAEVGPFAP
eukprot:jgi/Mesvir1/13730/Mv06941-RA.1